MKELASNVAALAFAMILVAIALTAWPSHPPRDATDPPDGYSGMSLFTDHETGCQYLASRRDGGLAPRVDADGRHMGCRK